MSREEKQQSQQAELQKQLWSIANSLRGNMDANDFKNYILGLIFYRYLSENLVNYVEKIKMQVCHDFTVDNLKYLAAGGRVKATTAFVGNILKIGRAHV